MRSVEPGRDHLAAGWRFRAGRVAPYAGAGVVLLGYSEESDFAVAGDDVDERRAGALVLAGADVTVVGPLKVGGELRYRMVQGVLGAGGVSQLFGDDQLGSLAFALRVSVGR